MPRRYPFALILALCGAAAAPGAVRAQSPVVVELFTAQGCAACPPADAFLAELATRADVIALALHVDYWDYIGWRDTFAQGAFTERQKASRVVVRTCKSLHVRGRFTKDLADSIRRRIAIEGDVARGWDYVT